MVTVEEEEERGEGGSWLVSVRRRLSQSVSALLTPGERRREAYVRSHSSPLPAFSSDAGRAAISK